MPYDGYPQNCIDEYNIVLLVIYNMMTVAGVIFAVVCTIFNFIFRNKKYSKNDSEFIALFKMTEHVLFQFYFIGF